MRIKRLIAITVLSAGLLAMAGAQAPNKDETVLPQLGAEYADDGKLYGNTVPSERAEMTVGSRSSDVVLEVRVKKGDLVKPGDILAVEDTREEEAELRTTELMANSGVAVRAAEVTQRQKELEVQRMEGKAGTVFTQYEVDKARLDLDLSQLDIEKAQLEQARYKSQAEQLRTQIERKKLVSRINGVVREINIEKGGVIDPQKPAIVVINSPLWVDVHVPIELSLRLMQAQDANKKLEFGVVVVEGKPAVPAKVIFIDPQADPAGKSQKWTLEMANTQHVPSGLRLQVIPPQLDKVAEAKVK